jgi:hypothetical protein
VVSAVFRKPGDDGLYYHDKSDPEEGRTAKKREVSEICVSGLHPISMPILL